MKLTRLQTEPAILAELGRRLGQVRVERDLTQAQLAEAAGVSKRTIERLEEGASVQFSTFVRLARALDLVDRLDLLVPDELVGPVQQVKSRVRVRKRASAARSQPGPGPFRWGDGR